jgi:hypothetical protein
VVACHCAATAFYILTIQKVLTVGKAIGLTKYRVVSDSIRPSQTPHLELNLSAW